MIYVGLHFLSMLHFEIEQPLSPWHSYPFFLFPYHYEAAFLILIIILC